MMKFNTEKIFLNKTLSLCNELIIITSFFFPFFNTSYFKHNLLCFVPYIRDDWNKSLTWYHCKQYSDMFICVHMLLLDHGRSIIHGGLMDQWRRLASTNGQTK